jgi:cytochrome c oxidase assembly protein subunit 15
MTATRLLTPVARLLLALQALLVLTGGAVRVTGSGLGCPTWPECTPDSYTPVAGQAEGALHAWIEFGNRLLTFLLFFTAIAMVAIVIRAARRDLRLLALSQVGGIFGQAILGGITVLTKLNPISVASHFLLSMLLIAAAHTLLIRSEAVRIEKPEKSLFIRFHTTLTFIVIVAGTLVTGAGPHAGDADAPRLKIAVATVATFHGFLVVALILLTIAGIYRKFPGFRRDAQHYLLVFLVIALAQGIIGYAQYLLAVPEGLVAAHLLGSSILWIAAWRVRLTQFYSFETTHTTLERK